MDRRATRRLLGRCCLCNCIKSVPGYIRGSMRSATWRVRRSFRAREDEEQHTAELWEPTYVDYLRIMLSGKDPCDLWSRSDKSFKMPVETARDHGLQLVVARKKNGGTRQHHGQWSARSEEMESQLQRTKQSSVSGHNATWLLAGG